MRFYNACNNKRTRKKCSYIKGTDYKSAPAKMVKLLGYFNYKEVKKGKTSGSRVKFINKEGVPIMLHKPHPTGIMKHYQMKQIKEVLGL